MTQIQKKTKILLPDSSIQPSHPLDRDHPKFRPLLTSLLTRDCVNPRFHHPHHRERPTDDGHHRREIIVPGPVLFAVRHGDGG